MTAAACGPRGVFASSRCRGGTTAADAIAWPRTRPEMMPRALRWGSHRIRRQARREGWPEPVSAKVVLTVHEQILAFMNRLNGRCDPSLETLAERSGYARSTVELAVSVLRRVVLPTC
jgi:hypothetical protein